MRVHVLRLVAVAVMAWIFTLNPASAASKTIGADFAEMKTYVGGMGFVQKLGTPVNGMDNVVGDGKGALTQIVGNASGVASVGMTMIIDPADEKTNLGNVIRMSAIIDRVFPGWGGGVDWIDAALRKGGDTLVRDGKVLTLKVVPGIRTVAMVIKPAE